MTADQINVADESGEFFSLNAKYLIAPGATLSELSNDFGCLFGAGFAVFEQEGDGLTEAQWAGVYMLRQARAVFEEYERQATRLVLSTKETRDV